MNKLPIPDAEIVILAQPDKISRFPNSRLAVRHLYSLIWVQTDMFSTLNEVIDAVEMVFTLREIETHALENMRNYLRRYG